MSEKEKKKSNLLSRDISFGGKESLPTKKTINFVVDDSRQRRITFLIVLLVCAAIVMSLLKFGVVDPLLRIQEQERKYNEMAATVARLKSSTSDYDEVLEKYNLLSGNFYTEDELSLADRNDVLAMIDEDISPYISVQNIQMAGNQISVVTGETTMSVVSQVLAKLQEDVRNEFVTVTTTSAGRNENTALVTSDIEITMKTPSDLAEELGAQEIASEENGGGQ